MPFRNKEQTESDDDDVFVSSLQHGYCNAISLGCVGASSGSFSFWLSVLKSLIRYECQRKGIIQVPFRRIQDHLQPDPINATSRFVLKSRIVSSGRGIHVIHMTTV
jgi:hypothetical protein